MNAKNFVLKSTAMRSKFKNQWEAHTWLYRILFCSHFLFNLGCKILNSGCRFSVNAVFFYGLIYFQYQSKLSSYGEYCSACENIGIMSPVALEELCQVAVSWLV